MIFARRALQRRVDGLQRVLGNDAVSALAARLNRLGKDRMAAMWELVVLHGLSGLGQLRLEHPLPSGRRPDIAFTSDDLSFVADVTSVSDEGLDEQNPSRELSRLIEATKTNWV